MVDGEVQFIGAARPVWPELRPSSRWRAVRRLAPGRRFNRADGANWPAHAHLQSLRRAAAAGAGALTAGLAGRCRDQSSIGPANARRCDMASILTRLRPSLWFCLFLIA